MTGNRDDHKETLQNARTRRESKAYEHAAATQKLVAKFDLQNHAVEASKLFFWTLFFYPQGKQDCEESSAAKHLADARRRGDSSDSAGNERAPSDQI